jgi:hypothetical protein
MGIVCWILAALLMAAGTGKEQRVDRDEFARNRIERYKSRIGFSKLAALGGPDGVRADWEDLPHALTAELKDLELDWTEVSPAGLGRARSEWGWTQQGKQVLHLKVIVFGTGVAAAQQGLLEMSSQTMMVEIPYEAGPAGLGDLAVQGRKAPSLVVMWVFRNVCVHIDNATSGFAIEPFARAVQAFMNAHRVPRIAEHLPRISAIDVAPKKIHVGDDLKVSIVLSPDTHPASVVTDFTEVGELKLQRLAREPMTASYRAEHAGQAQVDIAVVDRKTLLSPPLSITIDVLPAR